MANSKSMSKSALISHLAEKNEMTRKQVIAFMDTLVDTAYKQAKNSFTLPGIGGRPPAESQSPGAQDPQPDAPANPAPQSGAKPNPAPRAPAAEAQPARPAISQIQQTVRAGAKERQARNRADESWNLRVPVKAGARDVVVTFLNSVSALDETPRLPFERSAPI